MKAVLPQNPEIVVNGKRPPRQTITFKDILTKIGECTADHYGLGALEIGGAAWRQYLGD